MEKERSDIVVVGAGAVGCAIAYFLSKAGLQVTILEKESIGSGSSAHATGLFTLLGSDFSDGSSFEMALASHSICQEIVPVLEKETSIPIHLQKRKAIRLALDDEEENLIQLMGKWQSKYLPIEWLSPNRCLAIEPRITNRIMGGMLEHDALQLDSYRLTLALATASELQGAKFKFRKVVGINHNNQKVTGVQLDDSEIECDITILATGSWSNFFTDIIQFPICVHPLKGERLVLKVNAAPLPLFVGSPKGGHIISRLDGFWSIGSTGGRDNDNTTDDLDSDIDCTPSTKAKLDLLERAIRVMPFLEDAQIVQQLAGSRPTTPDRKPLIGSVPNWQGLYLATGHTARGIHLSFITARMIQNYVLGLPLDSTFDHQVFSPARFNNPQQLISQKDPPVFEG